MTIIDSWIFTPFSFSVWLPLPHSSSSSFGDSYPQLIGVMVHVGVHLEEHMGQYLSKEDWTANKSWTN